jgi:hypothetical protein
MSKAKASPKEISKVPNTLAMLAVEAAEIARLLTESMGELSPEIEKRLEVNEQALISKADGYNFIIEQLEANAAMWKRRKDACAAQQKKFEGQIERLKDRIKEAMRTMDRTEVSGQFYKFQLRKSAAKLVIENEAALPADCKMVVQTTVVDKERVKAALVDGFDVPGARLEENGSLYILETGEEK